MTEHHALIERLIEEGYLSTPRIIAAFREIHRRDFLPEDIRGDHAQNIPLPIGYGQTISQPLTVAFMLEKLQPKPGDHVLDVGSGSGWQTTLLAHIIGPTGHITAIERIRPLMEFGKANFAKYHFNNVDFVLGDGSKGWAKRAPYDKVVVAAASLDIPPALITQLKVGGRLIIPVGEYVQDLVQVDKVSAKDVRTTRFPGFQFVPLIPNEWGSEKSL